MVISMQNVSTLSPQSWKQLDVQLRRKDLDRWLSSRYASSDKRQALLALYLFNYELARVRMVVSEPTLGAIRFQWWREALEEAASGKPRQHDVALALNEAMLASVLDSAALISLIDVHEQAFKAQDRSLEPEVRLAGIATKVLVPAHGWGEAIAELAPHYAALRRGEAVGYGPVIARCPSDIRPAIAHFRLRRIYARAKPVGAFSRRTCVMSAMFSGVV